MSFGRHRDRSRKQGRRSAFRTPRKKILIVCEGANTEPQYFKQFANVYRNAIVEVEIAREHGVPLTVVRIATELKNQAIEESKRLVDSYLKYDLVWCVFDVDEHPRLPEALQMASRNGIEVALSNPCFELWLLLHHRGAPGPIGRHRAQAMLKKFVANYDKSVDFHIYQHGYEHAVVRAAQLDSLAESVGEPGKNPTTGVYKLTTAITSPS